MCNHLSPQAQNELLGAMERHIVLRGSVLQELTTSPFCAALADEVAAHNIEHMLSVQDLSMGTNKRHKTGIIYFCHRRENNWRRKIAKNRSRRSWKTKCSRRQYVRPGMRGRQEHLAFRYVSGRRPHYLPTATYVHRNEHCRNLVISESYALVPL